MDNTIPNVISDRIGHPENLIFHNVIGQTIYFFGSHCDKWNCYEWSERCDIGCEKLVTPKIKHIIIRNMEFKQIITASDKTKNFIVIGNDDISFDVNDLNKEFFLSESDAQNYLNTVGKDKVHIHYVDT